MPWKKFKDGERFCVHKMMEDGSKGERIKCHPTEEEADDHIAALYANVEEIAKIAMETARRGQAPEGPQGAQYVHIWEEVHKAEPEPELISETIEEGIVTEFRGIPPDVPLRNGVDLAALTEGDDKPFFLTVEISTVGRVSKNGLLHDEELARTLVTQINGGAPEGIMGHIKPEDRGSSYPVSDVHWLGAARHGTSVWAKGYIPKTATAQREHFRILKATNGRAATSIAGKSIRETVDQARGVWRAKDFRLEQLDLAPYTRAALPPHSDFVIASEMAREEGSDMDKVQELEAGVKQRDTRIQELETQLAEERNRVQEAQIREFDAALDTKISSLVNWHATGDAAATIETFRATVRNQILSEMGQERTAERLEEVSSQVWEKLKPLAETVRDALAGPPAVAPPKAPKTRIEDTPEARRKARQGFTF